MTCMTCASKRAYRARLPPISKSTWSKSTITYKFSNGPIAKSTFCATLHGICTVSPLRAALTMRFAENTQQHTSKSTAPATNNDIGRLQSVAPATKNTTHLLKTWQKHCACHATTLWTRRFAENTQQDQNRARLPSIFMSCHKMSPLPRNLTPLRAPLTMRFAENTQQKTRLKYYPCHA